MMFDVCCTRYSLCSERGSLLLLIAALFCQCSMATTTTINNVDPQDTATHPLILSLLAGLSTCLGASVVFFADNGPCCRRQRTKSKSKSQQPLSHKHMSFSLALAGSVMVTVSFYSLLPESFSTENDDDGQFLSIQSQLFWERVISFVAGCGLYWLLSKCAFPEPDAILGFDDNEENNENNLTTEVLTNANGEAGPDLEMVMGGASATSPSSGNNKAPGESKPSSSTATTTTKRQTSFSLERTVLRERNSSTIKDDDDDDNNDVTASPEESESLLLLKETDADDDSNNKRKGSTGIFWNRFTMSGSDLTTNEARRAWRVAMLLFISLLIHNFPEGFAVAASSIHSPKLGLTTALAIGLHNIPEGIAIAVPCLAARPDSPWLAFGLASLSGLAEPLGAAVALLVLGQVGDNNNKESSSTTILSTKGILSFVAGIMVMVAVNELFPEAWRHGQEGRMPMVFGTVIGIIIMIGSDSYLES